MTTGASRRRRGVLQWGSILWITVIWVLLWGDVSVANVLSGALLGVVVTLVLPLPVIDFHGRVRVWRVLVLVALFLRDLAHASVSVVALALDFTRTPRGAVVGVQLRNHSDLYLTITAVLSTLIPGTLAVEAHRLTGVVYMHVLDVEASGGIDKVRTDILRLEERVLRAFASHAELVEVGLLPPEPTAPDGAAGREVTR